MSFSYRRKQKPQTGKGIGGFLGTPSKLIIDVESDSAMNMTMDTIQGNSVIKEPEEKQDSLKRKATSVKTPSKKQKPNEKSTHSKRVKIKYPKKINSKKSNTKKTKKITKIIPKKKIIDMSKFNQDKYMKSFFKKK